MSEIVPVKNEIIQAEQGDIQCIAEACRWLVQVADIQEVRDFRDRVEEAVYYRKRRDYALEAVNTAAELKVRAERRIGEMLAEMPKNRGTNIGGNTVLPPGDEPRLADLGISKMSSHRWQRVASIPSEDFEKHLIKVKEKQEEITTAGLLKLVKQLKQPAVDGPSETCTVDDLQQLIKAGKRFGCIYADPPWQYGNQGTRAATDNHYQTMPTEEIAALPISQLTAEQAHLHLWTTNGFLPDAFDVLKAWGFTYKSCFVWCKPQMGIGNYWRVSHEFLLLGVRGSCDFRDRSQRSWAQEDRTTHSSKPERFRRMVEKVSPGPRLELFGRRSADGWVVWGNQIERTMFDQASNEPWVEEETEESASLFN